MTAPTLERPLKPPPGSNVRLRTWLLLFALPLVTVLVVLLGATVWATR
jgi:hypothetical protein